jgi:two-component sensor histidine kinase
MIKRSVLLFGILFCQTLSSAQEPSRREVDSMLTVLRTNKQGVQRLQSLLGLAEYQIFKPGENKIDFDSASNYLNEASRLNRSIGSAAFRGFTIFLNACLTKEKGQPDTARKMLENAIVVLKTGTDKSYLGKAYYELSSFYDHKELPKLTQKIAMVELASQAFHEAGNIEREAFSLKMLADLYNIKGDDEKSMQSIKRSLALYESIQYKRLQGVYAMLSNLYQFNDDYGHALQYALKALKSADADQDSTMQRCQIFTILGGIYRALEQGELSVKYFKDALEIAKKNNDRYSIALLLLNIVTAYDKLNRPHETMAYLHSVPGKYLNPETDLEKTYIALAFIRAYITAQEYKRARPYSRLLVQLADSKTLLDDSKNNINRMLATYFFATKQFSEARNYLARNRALSTQFTGSLRYALDCRLWFRLDSAEGNYQSALTNLITYKTITDSLFNVTKSRQLQQIEVEYETAKKEDSIKIKDRDIGLLTQQNKLQLANLEKASLIKNVTIYGILLALMIIGLLYRQYRQKQKSSILITRKNDLLQHLLKEKEWLLKEIHHRVKNNLQVVMSLLNSQSAYIDNEPALTAIHDSEHRVHAMALIHQKLYGSENVSSIDMSVYIRELASYLADIFGVGQRIRFTYDIEPVQLDVSQAVPLGLILNESITNAIKYAFPDGRSGNVDLSLSLVDPDHCLLTIADNGIGMPSSYVDSLKPGSLGMSLIHGLSDDLNGKLTITSEQGTLIKILFKFDKKIVTQEAKSSSLVLYN